MMMMIGDEEGGAYSSIESVSIRYHRCISTINSMSYYIDAMGKCAVYDYDDDQGYSYNFSLNMMTYLIYDFLVLCVAFEVYFRYL